MSEMTPRVALYSHDTLGLGHVRRNLLIAQALAQAAPAPVTLLITGAQEAAAFSVPSGADMLILPALRKAGSGLYQPRRLSVATQDLIALRARTIRAALESFQPDVLIVDNVPRGALRELEPTLQYLRARGRTFIVLGLRDVLDAPAAVRREWRRLANEDAILSFYDEVWVYGDRAVYDPVREYGFSAPVVDKIRYAGYLDQYLRLQFLAGGSDSQTVEFTPPSHPFALCLLGGGEDGIRLGEAFVQAELPPQYAGIVLMGARMPKEARVRLRRLADGRGQLRLLDSFPEPALLSSQADQIVAMGGYNTLCEVLSFEKRALIVPRVTTRQEQLIRADRLREMGLVEVLHPDHLTPHALTAWLRERGPAPRVRGRIDLDGLARVTSWLQAGRLNRPDLPVSKGG